MTVIITDHALLRYLERMLGIDVERHRESLASLAKPYVDSKCAYAVVDGCRAVIDGNRIVTFLPFGEGNRLLGAVAARKRPRPKADSILSKSLRHSP